MLRRSLKVYWKDEVSNKIIRKTGEDTAVDLIKQRKLKLQLGNVCRMKETRLLETVALGIVDGDRPRGRPARRWSHDTTDWCCCTLISSLAHPACRWNAACADKIVTSLDNACYLSALEMFHLGYRRYTNRHYQISDRQRTLPENHWPQRPTWAMSSRSMVKPSGRQPIKLLQSSLFTSS